MSCRSLYYEEKDLFPLVDKCYVHPQAAFHIVPNENGHRYPAVLKEPMPYLYDKKYELCPISVAGNDTRFLIPRQIDIRSTEYAPKPYEVFGEMIPGLSYSSRRQQNNGKK